MCVRLTNDRVTAAATAAAAKNWLEWMMCVNFNTAAYFPFKIWHNFCAMLITLYSVLIKCHKSLCFFWFSGEKEGEKSWRKKKRNKKLNIIIELWALSFCAIKLIEKLCDDNIWIITCIFTYAKMTHTQYEYEVWSNVYNISDWRVKFEILHNVIDLYMCL